MESWTRAVKPLLLQISVVCCNLVVVLGLHGRRQLLSSDVSGDVRGDVGGTMESWTRAVKPLLLQISVVCCNLVVVLGLHGRRQLLSSDVSTLLSSDVYIADAIESLLLTSTDTQYQPVTYMRYIDDVLGVWTHGAENLDDYFRFLNSFHPALKFTIERTDRTPDRCIPFLDTLITVQENGSYSTELYIKPMAAPIIIHYSSAHPMQCKYSVLYSQLLRAKRLGSDQEAQKRGLAKIATLFRHNGYPTRLIERTKHRVMYFEKQHSKGTDTQKRDKNTRSKDDTTYISLPYIDDTLARRVDGAIRSSGLKVRTAWTSGKTLAKHMIRSALDSPPCPAGAKKCHTCEAGLPGRCHTKNAVYKISCNLCDENQSVYIGESKRRVRERYNEHLRDAKNKARNTPLGDHVNEKHPSVSISSTSFKISILRVCKDVADLKIAESVEIRNQKPCLNTQVSSWPLIRPPPYTPV